MTEKSTTMDPISSTSVTTVMNLDLSKTTTSFQYIDQPDEGAFFRHFENIILPCIILAGLIGNLTFILTVIRMPSLHKPSYFYLTCLACTDLFTLIGFIGLYAEIFIPSLEKYISIEAVFVMISWVFFIWSLCLVTLVSMERYLAICHPIKHHLLKGTRRTFKMIAVSFLFTLVMSGTSIPDAFDFASLKVYSQITFIIYVGFFLSCLTYNCYMYVRILEKLKQRQYNRKLQLSPEFERNIQQMAIMVIINGVMFFTFTSVETAYIVTSLVDIFKENLSKQLYYDEKIFELVLVTSMVLNASVNPIIYFITNCRYQDALKKLIMRLFSKSRRTN